MLGVERCKQRPQLRERVRVIAQGHLDESERRNGSTHQELGSDGPRRVDRGPRRFACFILAAGVGGRRGLTGPRGGQHVFTAQLLGALYGVVGRCGGLTVAAQPQVDHRRVVRDPKNVDLVALVQILTLHLVHPLAGGHQVPVPGSGYRRDRGGLEGGARPATRSFQLQRSLHRRPVEPETVQEVNRHPHRQGLAEQAIDAQPLRLGYRDARVVDGICHLPDQSRRGREN